MRSDEGRVAYGQLVAAPFTQMLSHEFVQQNGSNEQTMLQQVSSLQPGVPV